MTYAQMVIRRNGIRVHVEDSCSPDNPDLNVCPIPKPGPKLIQLAEVLADQRTIDLPPGHRFRISVTRARSTMRGRTSSVATIQCDGCGSKIETGPIRLNLNLSVTQLKHHLGSTWKAFEKADFGQTCKEARRLKKVKAVMDQ